MVLPLLNLIRAAGTAHIDLANKASSILRLRIDKAKEIPSSLDTGTGSKVLKEIHEMARKSNSTEFSNLLSGCSTFVSRSLDSSGSIQPVIDTYSTTLKEFMTQKHTLLHASFVIQYIRRHPVRAWPLHSTIAEYLVPGSAVNTYRQVQAYEILAVLAPHLAAIAKSQNTTSSTEEVAAFVTTVAESFYAILRKAGAESEKDKDSWNAQRLKEVVKAMLAVGRGSKSAGVAWETKKLQGVVEELKGGRVGGMKGVMGMLVQLVAVVGGGSQASKGEGKGNAKKGKGKGKATTTAEATVVNGVEGDGDIEMADGVDATLSIGAKAVVPEGSAKPKKEKKKSTQATTASAAPAKVFSNGDLLLPPVMPASSSTKRKEGVEGGKKEKKRKVLA